MATYVVTGGTGFVGQALIERLRASNHNVIVASRTRHDHDRANDWIEFDLRDLASANNIINARPDGVFHLAWSTTPATAELSPAADVSTNLAGTINLLDQIAKAGDIPVVLISSGGAVYGEARDQPISEHQETNPLGIYGTTKLAMERYATCCKLFANLDVRIARVSNPFGPKQAPAKMQGAATVFAHKIIRREPIEIWGDGKIIRDYIDVTDVAGGLIAIMEIESARCAASPIYNVGSGEGRSLIELIRQLEEAAGLKANVRFMPQRNFDVPINILDVSKLRNHTRWAPGNVNAQLHALMQNLRQNIDRLELPLPGMGWLK